jgi:hypothetical protein
MGFLPGWPMGPPTERLAKESPAGATERLARESPAGTGALTAPPQW